jgi:hypothetical protein
MHAARTILLLILLTSLCQFFRSCESEPYRGLSEHESVWVKIDSIHIPSEIKSRVAYAIECFGTIVNNGCLHDHDCGYIATSGGNNTVIYSVYAHFDFQDRNCTNMMDCSIKMAFPAPGIYNLKIMQPDSTFLVTQITVN